MPPMTPRQPTTSWAFRLVSEADTERLGHSLGRSLRCGEHLALTGGLGAGKTTLCRYLAAGFGVVDLSQVASPTYAYAHTYPAARGGLHHLDFYRLQDAESAYALGLDDILADAHGLCLIEWANRAPELIAPHALWLHLCRHPEQLGRDGWLTLPAARAAQVRALWPQDIATHSPSAPRQ